MTSIRTKQKLVAQEVLYHYPLPEGNQKIVKVTDQGANNLHQIETEEGERYLVSMPVKFRNWIWIKRGSYCIIEPIAEGNKVKGEITAILYPDQMKYIDENGLWPQPFAEAIKKKAGAEKAYLDEDLLPPSSDDEVEFDDAEDKDTDIADDEEDEDEEEDEEEEGEEEEEGNEEEENEAKEAVSETENGEMIQTAVNSDSTTGN